MSSDPTLEICSARLLEAPVGKVYQAFADPLRLARWWAPEGFTNTFGEFDLRPGGKWVLTMHGPGKGHYENASVFQRVEPRRVISWSRVSQPHFDMEVGFEEVAVSQTRISFRMRFKTEAECEKIRPFATPKNEENFDRLERELLQHEN